MKTSKLQRLLMLKALRQAFDLPKFNVVHIWVERNNIMKIQTDTNLDANGNPRTLKRAVTEDEKKKFKESFGIEATNFKATLTSEKFTITTINDNGTEHKAEF